MTDPVELLRRVDDAVEPDPAFRDRLMRRVRDELRVARTTCAEGHTREVATVHHLELVEDPPGPSSRRWKAWIAVAAAMLLVMAVAVTRLVEDGSAPTNHRPDPRPRPEAPLLPEAQMRGMSYFALRAEQGRIVSVVRGEARTLADRDGDVPAGSPWGGWTDGAVSITDVDGLGGGTYIATCCDPRGTIWRNGEISMAGTKIDILPDGALRGIVDPETSRVHLFDLAITEPHAIDIAWVDDDIAALLLDGPARLVFLGERDLLARSAPARRTIELAGESGGACAVVALEDRLVLLIGVAQGDDRCVGDRIVMVDVASGRIVSSAMLPADVRAMNSDHVDRIVAVTVDGDVILGDLTDELHWSTLLEGDYLAASLW